MKRGRVEMSLWDAVKVPNFNVLDFDLDEQAEGEAGKKSILDDVDSDPEVRSLDEALQYPPSSASLKSEGVMVDADPKPLVCKRKNETLQIRSSDPLPMSRIKKNKKGSSRSGGDVMVELYEHLTGGTTLDSSLGPDRFIDDEKDQVSSLPPSWFGPELMSFFRYADVFSDDMEIDPTTAEEKFVPDWDIRNKDSMMDELVAGTLLFNISTPLDQARGRRMKNQDLGAMVLSNQAQSNIFCDGALSEVG
ncbi:hypothetical protein HanPI659440_Chr03g0135831 [Helianthus annuus]|nr:hypothetical protein HanPI659440_Chr03g0135831 [Helianthus annuus]